MGEVKAWMRKLDDPASKYAVGVLDGEIVAGEHIQNTCRRHFQDLQEKKFVWKPTAARRPYEFMRRVCFVLDYETYHQKPMQLMDWQKFLLWSLHGWRVGMKDDNGRTPGTRRFQKVFLTSAKNTGKSAFFAGHLLYLLTMDGFRDLREDRWVDIRNQNCVISASTLQQAQQVGLRPAIAMMEQCELFTDPSQAYCELEGGNKRPKAIFCHKTGGRLMVVTTRKDGTGLGGRILHALHMEQITETNDFDRWKALEAGFKNSKQPLMSIATNPSPYASGIAYREYTEARQAARGEGRDSVLSLIYSADDADVVDTVVGDVPWVPDESTWRKGNPGLPFGVPRTDYIKGQIERAGTPRQRREVLRLNFGVWKGFGNGVLSLDVLNKASLPKDNPRLDTEELRGMRLWMGMDLARKTDLSALAFLWQDGDRYWLKVKSYLPQGRLASVASECSADLNAFVDAMWIQLTAGQVNDYQDIIDDLVWANEQFDLQGVAMDAWDFNAMATGMEARGIHYAVEGDKEAGTGDGILFIPHPQGFVYSKNSNLSQETSITAMERLFHGADGAQPAITIERNPLLAHAVDASIVKESEKLTRKITKRDALNHNRGKVDALIATIMACGLADRGLLAQEVEYNPIGIYGSKDFNPSRYVL